MNPGINSNLPVRKQSKEQRAQHLHDLSRQSHDDHISALKENSSQVMSFNDRMIMLVASLTKDVSDLKKELRDLKKEVQPSKG